MQQLLDKQRAYFATGATLPLKARIAALKSLRSSIYANQSKIYEALKSDLGKSATESYMCEVGMTLAEINFMIKHVRGYSKNKRVKTPMAQHIARSYIKSSPYGCVLVMSPWNYPFMLSLEPLVDAIAAGNTVILKPSAYSPATSALLADIVKQSFPPELATTVLGGRAENSALLDMPFDKIFFTGSVAVGKEVMRRASERLTPVTLELGGKSPCIVDKTANIPLAAKRIVFGKFLNCGQTCVAPDYIYAHASIKDKLLSCIREEIKNQFGEHPLENAAYGKIISQKHFNRIVGLIDRDKIYCGGEVEEANLRIAPTVMDNVTRSDAVMGEEIFGPVLPVMTYENINDVIADVNNHPHPLALYIFANSRVAEKVTSRCQFGGGCVNDVIIHLATSAMGFGGVGESGMGSYHGKAGFDCFTHKKSIVDKATFFDMPVRYQPYTSFKSKLIKFFMK
ncbi:MAG TPA: aldehyde dehydrogenase [Candidatus Coproplasma excrementipullorum]|nr:aldehyde dehydrogenase [Candidatus Coproplasma excrementipullorum]